MYVCVYYIYISPLLLPGALAALQQVLLCFLLPISGKHKYETTQR